MSASLALVVGFLAVQTVGPAGFYDACARWPAECAPVVKIQSPSFAAVSAINHQVNASIRAVKELPGSDRWQLAPSSGDCEDYAMTKRHGLIAAGLGSADARIAVGDVRGERHAVLVVTLGRQSYVLDNLTDEVLPVDQSTVIITGIQSRGNPRVWLRLRNPPTLRSHQ